MSSFDKSLYVAKGISGAHLYRKAATAKMTENVRNEDIKKESSSEADGIAGPSTAAGKRAKETVTRNIENTGEENAEAGKNSGPSTAGKRRAKETVTKNVKNKNTGREITEEAGKNSGPSTAGGKRGREPIPREAKTDATERKTGKKAGKDGGAKTRLRGEPISGRRKAKPTAGPRRYGGEKTMPLEQKENILVEDADDEKSLTPENSDNRIEINMDVWHRALRVVFPGRKVVYTGLKRKREPEEFTSNTRQRVDGGREIGRERKWASLSSSPAKRRVPQIRPLGFDRPGRSNVDLLAGVVLAPPAENVVMAAPPKENVPCRQVSGVWLGGDADGRLFAPVCPITGEMIIGVARMKNQQQGRIMNGRKTTAFTNAAVGVSFSTSEARGGLGGQGRRPRSVRSGKVEKSARRWEPKEFPKREIGMGQVEALRRYVLSKRGTPDGRAWKERGDRGSGAEGRRSAGGRATAMGGRATGHGVEVAKDLQGFDGCGSAMRGGGRRMGLSGLGAWMGGRFDGGRTRGAT